jgi:hypothetical protein
MIKDNEKLTITVTGPLGIGKTLLLAYLNKKLFNNNASIKNEANVTPFIFPNFDNTIGFSDYDFEKSFNKFINDHGVKEVILKEVCNETSEEAYERVYHTEKSIDDEYKHMEEFILNRGWRKVTCLDNLPGYKKEYEDKTIITTLESAYIKEIRGKY